MRISSFIPFKVFDNNKLNESCQKLITSIHTPFR